MRPEEKRSSLLDDYGNLRGWKFARLLVFPRSGESGRSGVGAEAAEGRNGRKEGVVLVRSIMRTH